MTTSSLPPDALGSTMDPLERRRRTIGNGVGWILFSEDGRPVFPTGDGEIPTIETTDEETELCRRVADRVLADLAALEILEQAGPSPLVPGPTSREILERQARESAVEGSSS